MNEKFAKAAIEQACRNAVNHNSNAAATLLKRIIELEAEAGIESPELAEAKKIAEQLEKESGPAPVPVPAGGLSEADRADLSALRLEIEKLRAAAGAQAPK